MTRLEQEVIELRGMVEKMARTMNTQQLTEANIPRTIDTYIDGSVASADGVLPMLIDGKRYDVLVNQT